MVSLGEVYANLGTHYTKHPKKHWPLMSSHPQPSLKLFSFDQLASEVNAIVEDLRWLHLELTLRNRCNEVLFHDAASIDELFQTAFENLRQKLSVLELSIFLKGKSAFRTAFRDQDPEVHWLQDRTPWVDAINRWFEDGSEVPAPPVPLVNHYTVDSESITTIAMPVVLKREYAAAILIVTQTSNIIPRLRKLLGGLSGSISLSIDYVRNKRDHKEIPSLSFKLNPMRESKRNEMSDGRRQINTEIDVFMGLRNIRIPVACVVDADCRIHSMNERMEEEAGIVRGWAYGKSLLDLSVPDRDHAQVRRSFAQVTNDRLHGGKSFVFPLKTGSGKVQTYSWVVTRLPDADEAEDRFLCMGIAVDIESAEQIPREHHAGPPRSLEARLSKQYRFMIKYVPFPVIHLDEVRDIIKNANPAFETIIGTRRWEGLPLDDFGSLYVHPGAADTQPCMFHVLSPNGITFTYHGMITPLEIHGKLVREVKLDPIESLSEQGVK